VRALVGGRDYYDSPFNRAVNAFRQPGSAFKPIVWTAAIEDSVPANAIIPDTAIAIPLDDGKIYSPENSDREFLGALTIRNALAKSRNTVAVQLAMQVGLDSVASVARRIGITTPIAPYPSSAIGASAVQPLDLVAAYSAFANLGAAVQPRFIHRIEDMSGRSVRNFGGSAPQLALDPLVAFIVRDVMRDAVDRGTGSAVRRYVPATIPVAGKTGTTNDNTDVWFVGTTPELVAGVWLGFDQPKTITAGAAGGTLAAPIWGQMISRWYQGRGSSEWAAPAGLLTAELDRDTGLLATPETPIEKRYTEYFLPGTEPGAMRVNPWKIFRWVPIAF
jgi:penicillin-binding protein 1A